MKRVVFLFTLCAMLCACHGSLEDRAAKECEEFTLKKCPTPMVNNTQLDSMVYEPNTRTIHYYYTFFNEVDDERVINAHKTELRKTLLETMKAETGSKMYKDAGFNFKYSYASNKQKGKVLFEVNFTKNDYK